MDDSILTVNVRSVMTLRKYRGKSGSSATKKKLEMESQNESKAGDMGRKNISLACTVIS